MIQNTLGRVLATDHNRERFCSRASFDLPPTSLSSIHQEAFFSTVLIDDYYSLRRRRSKLHFTITVGLALRLCLIHIYNCTIR